MAINGRRILVASSAVLTILTGVAMLYATFRYSSSSIAEEPGREADPDIINSTPNPGAQTPGDNVIISEQDHGTPNGTTPPSSTTEQKSTTEVLVVSTVTASTTSETTTTTPTTSTGGG